MANLIRNTDPSLAPPRAGKTEALEKVSYHLQAAMQEMRDDPVGSLEFEQHCTAIYQLLYQAMNLLVTGPPRPPSCLQSDLDDVMGGADGTAKLSQVQDEPSTPE